MLTFNEMVPPAIVEVGIKPLSFKKINEYARELRTYGYLKLRPEAGMTIGSLFFDIDRIKTRYNNQFQNSNLSNLQKSMLRQLCHAIKCLWMWKKRSRNKIDLLLDFLKFTYENSYEKADRSTICELAGKVDDLIYYQDIEKDTFEVEDIIVTQVFQYYSSEPSDDLLATESHKGHIPLYLLQRQTELFQKYNQDPASGEKLFGKCPRTPTVYHQ